MRRPSVRTIKRACYLLVTLVFLLAMSSVAVRAQAKPPPEKSKTEKPVVPVFAPGAKVVIEATFSLPPGYDFGDDPAVTYTFDPKVLKKHPFTVSPLVWKFTREQLKVGFTKDGERTREPARLQLRVNSDAAYGDHLLPAMLRVDFCSKEEGFCTWTELPVEFRVRVGSGKKALRKGALKVHLDLDPRALLGD